MFEIIFFIIISVYFILLVTFDFGSARKFPKLKETELPSASVIVAARNEEDVILQCLNSLNDLIYPDNKLEIIIVDDNSTDTTYSAVENYIQGKERFKLVKAVESKTGLKGKANAISTGINAASGEIILTTDADCSVHKDWAMTMASYFTGNTGLVCGYTKQAENTFFSAMQSYDFIYLLKVAAGTMNLNKPLSCIGNNMSYRKDIYNSIGGYEALPFSVTEDFSLLNAFNKLGKYKIIYPMDEKALIVSKPCSNIRELIRQKKRWGIGGLDSDIAGFAVMASAFLMHLMIILSPFLFSIYSAAIILIKFLIDWNFLRSAFKKLNIKFDVIKFTVFEIYFILYVFLLPIIIITNPKIKWKDRVY